MLKITGYADQVSIKPGDRIRFMVNCESPTYVADVVRVIHGDTNPQGPGVKLIGVPSSIAGTYRGRPQRIYAGSFGIVEPGSAFSTLSDISIAAIIQPSTPLKGVQGLVTHWDPALGAGFALLIGPEGRLTWRVGGRGIIGEISTRAPLRRNIWYRVGASFNARAAALTVWQDALGPCSYQCDTAAEQRSVVGLLLESSNAPLLFAAMFGGRQDQRLIATSHYNGKIEAPILCANALDRAALTALQDALLRGIGKVDAIGAWDFSRDISGTRLDDVSGNSRHGRTVNMPTRGVVGHHRQLDVHDWKQAPRSWGAIHFHDDDVYDAGWEPDFEWQVPADLRSGIYAVRLEAAEQTQFITFVVRPGSTCRRAKLLYLFPVATYMAYANEHFGTNSALVEKHLNRATVLHPHQIFLNEHREYGHSLYDLHSDGSGVYYTSRLRPVLNMQPFIESNHGAPPSNLWQFNADTHITDWLEANSIDYDVCTDEDLHNEGLGLLRNYSAVMTGTHPEYYSDRMWTALYDFTRTGGRLIYMGGNGFYWRVAFHPVLPGLMEVRRAEGGSRAWEPPTGEYYHSFTGEYGGMWRRQGGHAPNVLVGVGFVAQGFDESSYFVRRPGSFDPRAAFIFEGIADDEKIGDFGLIGGGASGMEIDCANVELGTPPHALVLASSAQQSEAHVLVVEEMLFNFMGTTGDVCPEVRADLVFFETPGGGAVFSTSSIAWAGALSHNKYDNSVSRITRNVVNRFLDPTPFEFPTSPD